MQETVSWNLRYAPDTRDWRRTCCLSAKPKASIRVYTDVLFLTKDSMFFRLPDFPWRVFDLKPLALHDSGFKDIVPLPRYTTLSRGEIT